MNSGKFEPAALFFALKDAARANVVLFIPNTCGQDTNKT